MSRRQALVLGLGRFGGGVASVRHLVRLGYRVRVTDRATAADLQDSVATLAAEPELEEHLEWRLGEPGDDTSLLDGIELLVCNPGIPSQHPLLEFADQRDVPITQEVNLFLESYPGKVVAVSGTNGKSTTATLLANALRRCGVDTLLGGNIGHSLLDEQATWSSSQVAVLELSSFQLERIDPDRHRVLGTVLTRITADHLDRHGDLASYQAAKGRAAAMADEFLVHTADDQVAAGFAQEGQSVLVHGPHDSHASLAASSRDGMVWSHMGTDPGPVLTTPALKLPGDFQVENVMAAFLATTQITDMLVTDSGCRHSAAMALATTKPLTNRLQLSATVAGRHIFGNAVSTQIDSTLSAIDSLPGQVHWVGGGKSKDGEYSEPGSQIGDRVASAHLFGAVAMPMAKVMGNRVATTVHQDLEQALDAAWATSRSGDTILFSPAFASFDQFPNFAARARRFDAWVHRLREETSPTLGTSPDLPSMHR
ncbi:MAG: UDP-N-acetylmuramoyl-L-alanine--D-glutamate ligase [Planctomycetota bacterium]|nr:UDP-N-acetylmuramoyl-L-alanine--D-glutamate ligase [Planctomycetota bacterium]